MIKKLKLIPVLSMFVFSFAVSSSAVAIPACEAGSHYDPPSGNCVTDPPPTPTATTSCPQKVFGFPAWYRGVAKEADNCEVRIASLTDLLKIPLNILGILVMAVAYAAVGFIIWGGFKYTKSQGDPGKLNEAKGAITNALIGLGIALGSVAIVEFIQSRIL